MENQNNVMYVSDLITDPKVSRRDALTLGGLATIATIIAGTTGCVSVGKRAHNLINYYALVLDDNGNVYRFQGKIDTPEEKEGYEILKPKRDIIANDLISHMDEKSIDNFTKALFDDMNANKAGTILYQNFKNGNVKDYQKLAGSLIKIDPYIDWKDVGLVALATAAITLGALYGFGVIGGGGSTSGGGATAASGTGGGL